MDSVSLNTNVTHDVFKDKNKQIELNEKILAEKVNILNKNLFVSVPSSFVCAAIVFIAFYRIPHTELLIDWFIGKCLVSGYRLALAFIQLHTQSIKKNFYYLFLFGTALSGILWGLAGSLLMPPNYVIEQTIAVVVIAGVTAGGIQSLQGSFVASILYIVLAIVPLCTWIFLQNDTAYTILGCSTTLYLFFTIIVSFRGNKFLHQTLSLKYQNIYLANNLTEIIQELKETNQVLTEKENNIRLIHDNAPIGMAIVSLDGRWLNVNNKLCQIVGYSRKELEKHTMQDITYYEDIEIDSDKQSKLLSGKIPSYQIEKRYVRKNGKVIWILTNVSLVRCEKNKPLYFISQIQDINDKKENEKVMARLNNMNEILQLCHNSIEAYPIICQTAKELFPGLSGGLAIFNKVTNTLELMGKWGIHTPMKSVFNLSDCWGFRAGKTYIVKNPNSEPICHHFEGFPLGGYMCVPLIVQNNVIGVLSFNTSSEHALTSYQQQIINNLSEIVKLSLANIHLNEKLREQAIHDPLTGMLNRRYLYEWLPYALENTIKTQKPLCIAIADLDHFKRINDRFGHDAGDEVLKFFGNLLNKSIRSSDVACRFGGEEFIIAFIGSDIEHARPLLEHIRNGIKNSTIQLGNQTLPPISVSIGLAEAPRDGRNTNDIIKAADAALYTAKESGRDRIVAASSKETVLS